MTSSIHLFKPRFSFQRSVLVLALLALALLLIGEFGTAWWVELINPFRVHFCFALLLSALLLFPNWVYVLVLSLMALWALAPAFNYLIPSIPTESITQSSRQISVYSHNLYYHNPKKQQALAAINAAKPDVLGLLEVSNEWRVGLAALASDYAYGCGITDEGPFSLWLFSRLPLAECEVLSPLDVPLVRARLRDLPLTIWLQHPPPPLGAVFTERRQLQLHWLALQLQQRKEAAVIMGDFNLTPWSPQYRRWLKEANLTDPRLATGLLPSWRPNAMLPWVLGLPIDHVFAFGPAKLHQLHRGEVTGSDHAAMLATIVLPPSNH